MQQVAGPRKLTAAIAPSTTIEAQSRSTPPTLLRPRPPRKKPGPNTSRSASSSGIGYRKWPQPAARPDSEVSSMPVAAVIVVV